LTEEVAHVILHYSPANANLKASSYV
jgi:hypothetical protein